MAKLITFEEQGVRRIVANVRRLERLYQNLRAAVTATHRDSMARQLRFGKTEKRTAGTYPTSGCVFPVRLLDRTHDETEDACNTVTDDLWSKWVTARAMDGKFIAEGRIVLLFQMPSRSGPRWWISEVVGSNRTLVGKPQSDHTTGIVRTYNVWIYDSVSGDYIVDPGGETVEAYQESGYTFKTANLCELQEHDTNDPTVPYVANLHPYEDCEVGDSMGVGAKESLTISGGAITITGSHVGLYPETGTSDTLNTINGGVDGMIVRLTVIDSGDSITVPADAGNVRQPANFVLNDPLDNLWMSYDSAHSKWVRMQNNNVV